MAKDGSMRGGARRNSGKKSSSLSDKLISGGTPSKPLNIVSKKDSEISQKNLRAFLCEKQYSNRDFSAADVCRSMLEWLAQFGCEDLIPMELIEQYAVAVGRWQQCESYINKHGLEGKHPTTGAKIASPYITMSHAYMNKANQAWCQIYQLVKENASEKVTSYSAKKDDMEELLTKGRGE